jgi:hypothetical protein
MRKSVLLALTALTAAGALASAVGSASARNLSISNQSFRAVWNPLTLTAGGVEIRCRVTLEGSFHARTIAKVVGSLIGLVTRALVGRPCTGLGEAFVFNGSEVLLGRTTENSLPWHIKYLGFNGVLPRFEGIRLSLTGPRFAIVGFLGACLSTYGGATTTVNGTVNVEAGGRVTGLTAEPRPEVPGTGTCPSPGRFSGTGAVTLLGTATPITVTLI